MSQATIVQTITVYPEKSIPGMIGAIGKQERSDTDMTFSDIPCSGIGDISGGYYRDRTCPADPQNRCNSNPLARKP